MTDLSQAQESDGGDANMFPNFYRMSMKMNYSIDNYDKDKL